MTSPRLLVAAALVALLVPAGALGAHGSGKADPSLTLNVNLGGALEVVLGNGTRIRTSAAPGTVIPPGSYLLIVRSEVPDDKDIFHLFHLTGAGVDMSSDLLPCENPRQIYTITLRPSSTYVYEDTRHPELSRVVFSTSASGSSSDTASAAAGHTAGGYSGSVSNEELLGSQALRGTLAGTVTVSGLTLTTKGKTGVADQVGPLPHHRRRPLGQARLHAREGGEDARHAHEAGLRRQAHGDDEPHARPLDVLDRGRQGAVVHRRHLKTAYLGQRAPSPSTLPSRLIVKMTSQS